MCTSFHPPWWKHHRFCVTAAIIKSRPPPVWLPFLHSLPWTNTTWAFKTEKGPRRRQYPAKDEAASFPSWPSEEASFLLLSTRLQTTPIKIRVPLTHLVPVCRQHVSSRFFKKAKEATDGRAGGIPWRVGNILLSGATAGPCVSGWAEWSRASAWGHTLVPHRII